MARIVSLGAALQDIYLFGANSFSTEGVISNGISIDKISYEVGGAGVNSAIAFSRHGHEAIILSNIAHDPGGNLIIKTLDREGVDNSFVTFIGRKATGTSIFLVDSKDGGRTTLTYRGTSEQFGNLSEDDLDFIHPDWLYISTLGGDLETLERFMKKARGIGARVALNPGVKELAHGTILMKMLKYVDVLILNKSEASRLVPGVTLAELLYHLQNYVGVVVITDGPMGGIATNGEESYRFGLYENTKAKDRNGAGDAFGAGFLAHFAAGKSFRNSLVFGSANASSVVSKYSASRGIIEGNAKLHPMLIQKI